MSSQNQFGAGMSMHSKGSVLIGGGTNSNEMAIKEVSSSLHHSSNGRQDVDSGNLNDCTVTPAANNHINSSVGGHAGPNNFNTATSATGTTVTRLTSPKKSESIGIITLSQEMSMMRQVRQAALIP